MASFHQVRHKDGTLGGIAPCANDPCHLHGDDDIHADSLEEAYSIAYGDQAEGKTSSRDRKHPRTPKRRWGALRKSIVPLMVITMASSLSACGSRPFYDNDGVSPQQEASAPASSSSEGRYQYQGHDFSRLKDEGSRLKGKTRDYIERQRQKLDSMKDSGAAPESSAASGVPASLAANEQITKADLESLTVVPDHGRSGAYLRRQWSGGKFLPTGMRTCWSVRDEVIKRQADPGTLRLTPDGCAVEAVSFTDPYSGRRVNESGRENVERNIQIDHVIPVSYMSSNGGNAWNQQTKDEYYNDLDPGHLLAVESSENNLKSDYGPSRYMPSGGTAYRAAYGKDWVAILKSYQAKGGRATIEQSDYNAIMKAFDDAGVQ